jgi:hypothetical protein
MPRNTALGPWPLLALSAVGISALLTIAYVLFQWWSGYHFYGLYSAGISDKLDSYRVEADDLQRLVSLLVAFSSLYALVLGVTSYLSAQGVLEQAKDNGKRIEDLRRDLEKSYPFFKGMGDRMNSMKDHLEKLMPDSDERDDYYEHLKAADKQDLAAAEHSAVSWLYFLDFSDASDTASDIYRHLGKYYSARYSSERDDLRKRIDAMKHPPAGSAPSFVDVEERTREVERLADRAQFFLSNAIQKNSNNFLAYNDLAFLIQDVEGVGSATAENFYRTSIRLEPKQQRAYFDLAIIEYTRQRFKEAEELSTRALTAVNWQVRPNPERGDDVQYNRACYRNRLGEQSRQDSRKWADGVEADLKDVCRGKDAKRLELMETDFAPGKDLAWFASVRPEAAARFKKILAGETE